MVAIHRSQRRVELAIQRLDRSAMPECNRVLIKDCVNFKAAAQNIGLARQGKYLRGLTTITERYLNGRAYSSLTQEDVMEIVSSIGRSKLSDWTKYDYRMLLKTFMIWAGKEKEVNWIKTKKPRRPPEEILSEDDISKLIDSAQSTRDKAFVACLYEGGFRVGELGGLRIKDRDFDRYNAIAMVVGKTGMRRVRLIWSMPYLAQWLVQHPDHEDREAPLWVKKNGELLSYDAINKQLHRFGERAKISKGVNPHAFRHARSTHLASRLTEAQMEEYLGWVHGSRMPSIYVHMSGRDLDGDRLKMYGLEDKRDDEPIKLKMQECPHCRTVNIAGTRICMHCRKPLAVAEVMYREAKVEEMVKDFVDAVASDPQFRARFGKYLPE